MDCRYSPRVVHGFGTVLAVAALFATGCSQESPPVTGNSPQVGDRQIAEDSVAAAAAAPAPSAPAPDPRITERFEQLKQLTAAATTAEMEMRFADAVRAWEETLPLLRELYGENSWQVNNCRLALATARQEVAFTPQQIEQLRSVTRSQQEIGRLLAARDHAAALRIALESAPATIELFGPESWMAAKQMVQTARLQQMTGDMENAIRGFQQASEKILAAAGTLHPELEAVHGFLAECFFASGDQRLAFGNLNKAAQLAQALYGPNSLQFAGRANELGVALSDQKDFTSAVRILRASETIRAKELGNDHPLVAHSRLNQSIAMMGLGENDAALELATAAESAFRAGGNNRNWLMQALRQKAVLLMLVGKPELAEAPLRETLEIVRSANVADGGATRAEFEYRLAICLTRLNRLEEAATLLQESLATTSRLAGSTDPATVRTRDMLVHVLQQSGQTARAAELGGAVRPASFIQPPGNQVQK